MKSTFFIYLSLALFCFGTACTEDETGLIESNSDFNPDGKMTSTGYRIHEKVEEIQISKKGPFIRLEDGGLMTVESTNCCISYDEGRTWKKYPVFKEEDKYTISPGDLVLTEKGVIVLAFINSREGANWYWQTDISDSPDAILPTYAVRSLDGGKTWHDLQKLHDDWTGAIRDVIETRDGNIIISSMMMAHNPGRHTVVTYTSKDEGKSWTRSNIIDLGGIGHHGGVMEATIEQLNDGRIWMLMRTNWGVFWEAYSENEGLTWKDFNPTEIDASSAPGKLIRLKSGRLALVWNRYYPEGWNSYTLVGGDNNLSEVPVSWHREQLSIMFSGDDGSHWTKPVMFAKISKKEDRLSYPEVFEANPGELWVTTAYQGNLRVKLFEKDFIDNSQ